MNLNADSSDDESFSIPRSDLNADSSDDESSPVPLSLSKSSSASPEPEPTKKKTGRVIDSSDEDDDNKDRNDDKVKKPLNVSDDSDEEKENSNNTSVRKKKIAKTFLGSDSEDEHVVEETQNKSNSNLLKDRSLYDADSSDEETSKPKNDSSDDEDAPSRRRSDSENSENSDNEGLNVENVKSKKEKHDRKSKSSAMSEIRSESQRLLRESTVGLPYHRPKQRTLEEFLNRKKGTPEIVQSIKLQHFTEKDEKLLQERQKQLEEFYKSDEEEHEEDEDDADFKPEDEPLNVDEPRNEYEQMNEDESKIADAPLKKDELVPAEGLIPAESMVYSESLTFVENIPSESLENPMDALITPQVTSDTILVIENLSENLDRENVDDTSSKVLSYSEPLTDLATETEPEVEKLPESLDLVLDDTPEIGSSQLNLSKPLDRRLQKLEALKKQIEPSLLEKTLNITPKLGGKDDDEMFSPKHDLSIGATKLLNRFVTHANASGPPVHLRDCMNREELNIVTKKTNADGTEVLETENLKYNRKPAPAQKPKQMSFFTLKEKLKQEMLAKRREERRKKEEFTKLNNEEIADLPDEEEVEDDFNIEDEEEERDYDEDESEGESEPEENDVNIQEKKTKRGLFCDDEAEESGDEDGDDENEENEDEDQESDTESLNLVQEEDEDEEDTKPKVSKKKKGFKKIKNAEFLSDESNSNQITPGTVNLSELETPNNDTCSVKSMASSASSFAFNSAPRWTPYKDRINSEGVEFSEAEKNLATSASPTSSQMAKKKLGFEGLFDATDPEVEDIDDIVGLCSGKFATQAVAPISQFTQDTQVHRVDPESQDTRNPTLGIESQDTVILTGKTSIGTSRLDQLLGLDSQDVEDSSQTGPDICPSDDEELAPGFMEDDLGAGRILDSDDETDLVRSKKRRRCVISDDESENEEEDEEDEEDEEEMEMEKPVKSKGMFDKKGRLRKDFLENEAELSGSEDELSEDEDEKGLDRLELEEGDFDEIDEELERDKVGRIHQKVLLDADQAEIKLFQERFLEDGDLHTDYKRQRQFKWKGLDEGLELERRDSDGEEEEEEGVGTAEEQWRIQRLEREKWMKENDNNQRPGNLGEDSQFFKLAQRAMKKISSVERTPESIEMKTMTRSSSLEARNGPLQPLQALNRDPRSSFLARGQTSIEQMAVFNKKTDDRTGTGAKKSARNFVFAAISPEKESAPGPEQIEPNPVKSKKPPPAKKQKLERSLVADNRPSIFNLL